MSHINRKKQNITSSQIKEKFEVDNYLNIIVVSLSNLLQQMLILILHIIICLSNWLQKNQTND